MERDFLGLRSMGSSVKEESGDGFKDSVPIRSLGMQLSFSNKVSTLPQFLSFNAAPEDWPQKTVYDGSSGITTMSMTDGVDSNHRLHSAAAQKSWTLNKKQAGSRHSMRAYPSQPFGTHSANHPHDVKIYPVPTQPNQGISVAMNAPIFQSHLDSTAHGVVGSNQLPLGGFPVVNPISVIPSTSLIMGANDVKNASMPTGAPAQMTIFYAGSVSVYNDVPPEKAQAIMLLAGNGSSLTTPKTALSTCQLEAPIPQPPMTHIFSRNQPHTSSSCLALPSPVSSSFHAAPQSGRGPARNNEIEAANSGGTLATYRNQPETPKVISSLGSTTPTLIPSAVPQARKASLARFLEKRKERATTTMPYSISKKSPGHSTPESNSGAGLSTYSMGSSPLPAATKI